MAFNQGYALLISVGSHVHSPHLDVPITVADAEAVAKVLRDPGLCGYPKDQVALIHDGKATKAGILTALDQLAKSVGQGDTVFLFYCGHGALGVDSNYYLVSHDAQVKEGRVVPGTGVSEAELLGKLRAIPAKRVLMIFNACHSGNISPSLGADQAAAPKTSNPPEESASALLATGSGRIIIVACREEQVSYIGEGKNTIFTQALVDGLSGKGTKGSNGYVSAFRLYERVYETVSETVKKKLDAVQEPELTVLKGVGPFAVSLYKGASALGAFDETAESLPQGMAVREVEPQQAQKHFQHTITQSGGVNFGQGNKIKIDGDVFGGDKVAGDKVAGDKFTGDKVTGDKIDARDSKGFVNQPSGPVTQNFGQQIDTGGSAYIGGNVTAGGDFAGRDMNKTVTNVTNQGVKAEDVLALLKALQASVAQSGLDDDEKEAVSNDLKTVEKQVQKGEGQWNAEMAKDKLLGVAKVLKGAGAVAGAALPLADKLLEMGKMLFGG